MRIYPDSVEVDVLRNAVEADQLNIPAETEPTFAAWMNTILMKRGLSQEAAARDFGVWVRTMSRWIAGDTGSQLRDIRWIRDVFGEVPIN